MARKENHLGDPLGLDNEYCKPASKRETLTIIFTGIMAFVLLGSFLVLAAYGILHLAVCNQ